ncbi:MAG: polysaccharide deacetylase family protein [Candidatus Binatia bacterium]
MRSVFDKSPYSIVKAVLRRSGKPFASLARNYAGSVRCVQTSRAVAALTFDDGPHPEFTPALLEILRRHGAKATFFMIGESAVKYPEVVRNVAEAGHTIGNHSWSHLSLPLLSAEERRRQIRACEAVLRPYGQMLFRPPYGHQTWQCRWDTIRMGYEVVAFNVHAEDWLNRDATWMADRLVGKVGPGSIVILHDNIYRNVLVNGHHDRRSMLEALRLMLERLENRFEFVTVPELLRQGRPMRDNWYGQGPPELQAALEHHLSEARRHRSI